MKEHNDNKKKKKREANQLTQLQKKSDGGRKGREKSQIERNWENGEKYEQRNADEYRFISMEIRRM